MDSDALILALRVGFAVLLYLFLFIMGFVAYRDLKRVPTAGRKPSRSPRPAGSAPTGNLVVVESGDGTLIVGQSFELQPVTSIGRNPTSTVVVSDSYTSGDHALITWREQHWWVEDAGSTNGTLLNRHLVHQPTQLNSGDIIQVGRAKLKVVL